MGRRGTLADAGQALLRRFGVEQVREIITPAVAKQSDINTETYLEWLERTCPDMVWRWKWLRHVQDHLDLVAAGKLNKLLISAPPQHGKTSVVTGRFPVREMFRRPGLRTAIAAYSQSYANRLSRMTRRVARDAGGVFGEKNAANEWEMANGSNLLAVGIGAGVAGRSIDLGLVDDPIRSREEADSEAYRDRLWEWYMDDYTTRLQENAQIVIIMTRWSMDDLAGRIITSEDGPNWKYIRLPAIAEDNDPIGRLPGEALCPERFSLEKLEERRRILGEGFEGLYQQNPVPRGGLFFKREWFTTVDRVPEKKDIRRIRYWDLAATVRDSSAYTAGVLMAFDGTYFYVEHVERFRGNPAERNDIILKTAELDMNRPGFEKTWFEEQPGAAGVETSQAMIRKLAGLPCQADRVSGSKEVRAEPFADAARGGLVRVVQGGWTPAFISELASFPRGAWKDQVDSVAGSYSKLARGGPTIAFG